MSNASPQNILLCTMRGTLLDLQLLAANVLFCFVFHFESLILNGH